ncbi:MAG TPA: apolipoprotein N-acyltransferase [Rhizomicrobium sp.]|nr:apolipoprotein N-acyltransferase [Rhizomicrobium sp.]
MMALSRGASWVRGLTGWRRVLFAFACGAFSALGFAPVEFSPALLAGFAGLLLLLDGADAARHPMRAAFISGWAFAFGQFLIGMHWIGYAFLVDPSTYLWQMPFALLFLTAGLALFAGIACALALYFWQDGAARLLVFAIFYGAGEWLRGHLFTGFPWNLPAYGWGASLAVLQSLSLVGAYGLSFLTILLGASLAEFGSRKRAWRAPALMLCLFALLWAGGAARLVTHPAQAVPGVALRIVQPDIPQREKELSALYARNWQRLLDLSVSARAPGVATPTVIIWPEAAPPPFLFNRSQVALDEIGLLTGKSRTLITGEARAQRAQDKLSFYNSLFIFTPGGAAPAIYDKFHLVPFGEYVPFAGILNRIGITKLTEGQEGFASGDGPHTYQIPGAPTVTPLICYEIIFPAAVTSHQRPEWFVNVTDDSWFGPWAGPAQHLLIARARAIEEAIPVARAANTGISAVIDPYGRIIAQLNLGKMGVLDTRLPAVAAPPLYARYGDFGFMLLLIAAAALAFALERK